MGLASLAGLLSGSSSTLARFRLAKCVTALRFKADPLANPFPFIPLAAAPAPLVPPVAALALDPRAVPPPPLAPLETPPPLAALEAPPIFAPLESPPILAPLAALPPLVPLVATPPRGPTAAPPPLGPLAAAAAPFPALAPPPTDPRVPLVAEVPLGPLLRLPPLAEPLGEEDLLLIAPGRGARSVVVYGQTGGLPRSSAREQYKRGSIGLERLDERTTGRHRGRYIYVYPIVKEKQHAADGTAVCSDCCTGTQCLEVVLYSRERHRA